jgi:FAD/FMN-containing dehydrogenase
MYGRNKLFRWLCLPLAAVVLLIVAYAVLLGASWIKDRRFVLREEFPAHGDYSRLTTSAPEQTIIPQADPVAATKQLQELVRRAADEGKKISVAGSAHSMGGHTLVNGGWRVEMRVPAFQHIDPVRIENGTATVRVGAGATWHQLLRALDREGWSVAIMQSNDDFTIGGSISVNCHGWAPSAPPIVSTVASFTLLRADGSIVECRSDRATDRELFDAVCGGYGMFGIILEVKLRVVPNAFYRAAEFPADTNYAQRFDSLVSEKAAPPALAYGRLSTAPGPWFLRDARIIRFDTVRTPPNSAPINTVAENGGSYGLTSPEIALARAVFRASAGSDFGKLVRWTIERWHGQTHRILSRNGILQTPSIWFANRDPRFTEILHEYFVPPDRLAAFLNRIRPRLRNRSPEIDLLNVTVRKVRRDEVTDLAYAREDVFGLVILFRYRTTEKADAEMAELTRRLIDDALASRGTYYLPYRPHATVAQFRRAYPGYAKVAALKRTYDPKEIFQSDFYKKYLRAENVGR